MNSKAQALRSRRRMRVPATAEVREASPLRDQAAARKDAAELAKKLRDLSDGERLLRLVS